MIRPKECIKKIIPYKMPPPGRKSKARLDMNENTRGCSPKVLEAIRNVNPDDIATYPEYQGLIERIALFHDIKPDSILLTNGADDAFRCIMATYIEDGDEVIIPIPNYPMFDIFARQNAAKVVEVLYNQNLSFPTKKVIDAISPGTKMVVIVNPGNPTGSAIKKDDLTEMLKQAQNAIVLLDETYYQFVKGSYIRLIENHQNLFITHSFSKVYGLAGLRLGFIATRPAHVEIMRKVNLPFAASSLALIAANAALSDQAFVDEFVFEVEKEKKFLYYKFNKAGIEVHQTDANFILINFGADAEKIYEELKYRNILVKNLKNYPLLKGFLRITVGTHSENLVLLEVLEHITAKSLT